jgi:hypothetical protein
VVANSALPAVLERLLGGGPPPQPMRESAGE